MLEQFTIGALLYGEFPSLAQRCLRPLRGLNQRTEIRIGLNAVSHAQSRQIAQDVVSEGQLYDSPTNIHKYPMLRQMIHGIAPIETPYFMWFDDDSYIDSEIPTDIEKFFQAAGIALSQADMIGSIYTISLQGNQRQFIEAQSWYANRQVNDTVRFCTGGWWAIKTEVLYKFDYPWPMLDHRGGDVMLGAMCHQQQLLISQFRKGVKINADQNGNESKATRRGFDQVSIGIDFDPGISDALNRATSAPPVELPATPPAPPIKPIIRL